MKKFISAFIAAAMFTGMVSVSAQTQINYLVSMQDFESCDVGAIDDAGLAELGIIAKTDGKAEMSIVEINGNKMLAYKPSNTGTSIQFPISYELSEDENVVIEYDFESVATQSNGSDSFDSQNWGTIGLNPFQLAAGGNGRQYETYTRTYPDYRKTYCIFDTRNAIGGSNYKEGYTGEGMFSVKTVYDYGEYVRNAKSQDAMLTTLTNKASNTVRLTANGPIISESLQNLTFANSNGQGLVYIDNVRVYTVPKMQIKTSSVADNTENVFIETDTLNFEFTNEIGDISGLAVKADEKPIKNYTADFDGKKLTIKFDGTLEYGTVYNIDLSEVTDDLGQKVKNSSITFTTEQKPNITLDSLDTNTDNGLRSVGVKLSNTSGNAETVNVITAIYSDKNVLKNTVTATVSIAANSSREVLCGVIDNPEYAGGTVKTYIWNTSGTPYFKSITNKIN